MIDDPLSITIQYWCTCTRLKKLFLSLLAPWIGRTRWIPYQEVYQRERFHTQVKINWNISNGNMHMGVGYSRRNLTQHEVVTLPIINDYFVLIVDSKRQEMSRWFYPWITKATWSCAHSGNKQFISFNLYILFQIILKPSVSPISSFHFMIRMLISQSLLWLTRVLILTPLIFKIYPLTSTSFNWSQNCGNQMVRNKISTMFENTVTKITPPFKNVIQKA